MNKDIKRIGTGARMSEAVCYNGIVWVAGQVGNPGESVTDQTRTCLAEVDRILAEAAHNGWAGREQLDQILETEEEKSLIASLLFEVAGDDDLAKMANEGLRSMQRRFLEPKVRQIELEIATKGADLDSQLPSLLKQRAEIIRQLQHPPKLTLDS